MTTYNLQPRIHWKHLTLCDVPVFNQYSDRKYDLDWDLYLYLLIMSNHKIQLDNKFTQSEQNINNKNVCLYTLCANLH